MCGCRSASGAAVRLRRRAGPPARAHRAQPPLVLCGLQCGTMSLVVDVSCRLHPRLTRVPPPAAPPFHERHVVCVLQPQPDDHRLFVLAAPPCSRPRRSSSSAVAAAAARRLQGPPARRREAAARRHLPEGSAAAACPPAVFTSGSQAPQPIMGWLLQLQLHPSQPAAGRHRPWGRDCNAVFEPTAQQSL